VNKLPVIRLQQALEILIDIEIAKLRPRLDLLGNGDKIYSDGRLYQLEDDDIGLFRWKEIGSLQMAKEEVLQAQKELLENC